MMEYTLADGIAARVHDNYVCSPEVYESRAIVSCMLPDVVGNVIVGPHNQL